jgi:hypothetical protein
MRGGGRNDHEAPLAVAVRLYRRDSDVAAAFLSAIGFQYFQERRK